MVHTFSCLSKKFALDVESGSCFEIDDLVKELIDKRNSQQDLGDLLAGKYEISEIDDANQEIDILIKRGFLFSKPKLLPQLQITNQVKALCVNISHKCNLSCAYCFAGGGDYGQTGRVAASTKNMSLDTAKSCIDFLIQHSGNKRNLEIDFFGGEPLLNYQTIKDAISYGRQQEKLHNKLFKFTITTNGLNITDEMTEYFNSEVHNVVISIDGRESVHDIMRPDIHGQPSFKRIVKNAVAFNKKRQGSYYIRGTFTARNLDFSLDVIALADLGFKQISLEPVVLPDEHPLALREEHLPILLKQYELLAKEYLKRKGTDSSFNFFHFNIDLKGGPCLKKRLSGCGVGGEYLCVSVDGSIYPCHRFDGMEEYKMGSVMCQSPITLQSPINQKLSYYFQKSNLLTKPHCNDCFAKYFCSGGCNANNIEYGGSINAAHNISCELMRKRVECAIAIKIQNS